MFGYNPWIYHGETANVTGSSSVPKLSAGIPERDEMFDVLGDVISDVEGDPISGQSSNAQYDDLFTGLHSKLYLGMSSFSSLNFLAKLMHLKVMSNWT